jgi:hypothetical protein
MVGLAGWVPDFEAFDCVCRLTLDTGRNEMINISFHGIGPRYRGLVGVVAGYSQWERQGILVSGATFQINCQESIESVQSRYSAWLERVIVAGLTEWRKSL